MLFQFQIHVSEQDYIDYNAFHMFRSPYGRKVMRGLRIFSAVAFGGIALLYLVVALAGNGGWFGTALFLTMLVVFEVSLVPFMRASMKSNLKRMKKTGKMPYSPSAELVFCEEYFMETTEFNQTKLQYSAIERISIVDQKAIYIHVNNVAAYLLPFAAIASAEE